MNLILFGFKSSGKTHFGKLLSQKIGSFFIDTDDLVISLYEKQTGKTLSIREIFQTLQEKGFRSLEKRAIDSLTNVKASIIALGGGAILDSENGKKLQKMGTLVYLKASLPTLKERLLQKTPPAFLDPKNLEHSLEQIFQKRALKYEAISEKTIDVDQFSERVIVEKLEQLFPFSSVYL